MKWRPHVVIQQQGQLLPKLDTQPQARPDSVPKSKTITGSAPNTTSVNAMNGISNLLTGDDVAIPIVTVESMESGPHRNGKEAKGDAETETRSSDTGWSTTLPPQSQQHQAIESSTTSSSSTTTTPAPAEGLAAAG